MFLKGFDDADEMRALFEGISTMGTDAWGLSLEGLSQTRLGCL